MSDDDLAENVAATQDGRASKEETEAIFAEVKRRNAEQAEKPERGKQVRQFTPGGDVKQFLAGLEEGDTIKFPGGVRRVDKINRLKMQALWPPGAKPTYETLSVELRDPHGNIREYSAHELGPLLTGEEKKPVTPQVEAPKSTAPPVINEKAPRIGTPQEPSYYSPEGYPIYSNGGPLVPI